MAISIWCILGIYPLKAGFKFVKIAPQLGGLEYPKGKFPTLYDEIEVLHTKDKNGSVHTEIISCPKESEVEI